MLSIRRLLDKAAHSSFYLWLLNRGVNRMVPFNRPHHFQVTRVTEDSLHINVPYRAFNFNHIKGIHACALATVGELAAGMMLMREFDFSEYRLIMSQLSVDYFYQAKQAVTAVASLTDTDKQEALGEIATEGKAMIKMAAQLHDQDNNAICTVTTTWQIKPWSAVKTAR